MTKNNLANITWWQKLESFYSSNTYTQKDMCLGSKYVEPIILWLQKNLFIYQSSSVSKKIIMLNISPNMLWMLVFFPWLCGKQFNFGWWWWNLSTDLNQNLSKSFLRGQYMLQLNKTASKAVSKAKKHRKKNK